MAIRVLSILVVKNVLDKNQYYAVDNVNYIVHCISSYFQQYTADNIIIHNIVSGGW